ncbi:MAG: hypothetical protein AVO33_01550 [delta proteobacterium ML8_F1]|nr:MAG: hypothetical protein AVO33_01550 [delta proteobacterium ML8_F1]
MSVYHELLYRYEEEKILGLLRVTSSEVPQMAVAGEEMIINPQGEVLEGGIGRDSLRQSVLQEARLILARGVDDWIHRHLEEGKITIEVQIIGKSDHLYLMGGDLVSQGVYDLAKNLGFTITLVDHRVGENFEDRFKEAKAIVLGDFDQVLGALEIEADSYVLIATHGHRYDEMVLERVMATRARYIGLVSNSRKAAAIKESLAGSGVDIRRLYTPAGLKLGGKKPRDIALSIMAQIQAVRYDTLKNMEQEMV